MRQNVLCDELTVARKLNLIKKPVGELNNNNNNKHDNVYGAVIMAEPLREFTQFI